MAYTQRHLVGLRLHMADGEVATKYVFPFVDEAWTVAFTIVDAMSLGPRVFRGKLELRNGALHTKETVAQLEPIDSMPTKRFETLVHFDPWWAFKGVSGVDRDRVKAVLATNLAGTFFHEGTTYKLHDLEFRQDLAALDAVIAKDPVFKTASFHRSDVDLLLLRRPPSK